MSKIESTTMVESPAYSTEKTERTMLAGPVRPSWDRFFPGGYNKNRQIKLTGKRLTLACEVFAGVASQFSSPSSCLMKEQLD